MATRQEGIFFSVNSMWQWYIHLVRNEVVSWMLVIDYSSEMLCLVKFDSIPLFSHSRTRLKEHSRFVVCCFPSLMHKLKEGRFKPCRDMSSFFYEITYDTLVHFALSQASHMGIVLLLPTEKHDKDEERMNNAEKVNNLSKTQTSYHPQKTNFRWLIQQNMKKNKHSWILYRQMSSWPQG